MALPFLADEQPGDRDLLRFLLTLPAGVVVAIIAAAVGGALAVAAFAVVAVASGVGDAGMTRSLTEVLSDPDTAAHNLRTALFILVLAAGTNGAMAFAFVGVASWIQKRGFHSYLTVAKRFRWRVLLLGLALNTAMLAPLTVWENWGEIAAGRMPLLTIADTLAHRGLYAGLALVTLFVAALAEELFFRGWLLRHLSALTRSPWAAIALSALVFSAFHWDFNLDAFIARAVMGAGFAWMTLRLGGVELATGAHLANNLVIVLFIEPLTLKPEAPHELPPTFWVETAAITVGYLVITEIAVRVFPPKRPRPPEDASVDVVFE